MKKFFKLYWMNTKIDFNQIEYIAVNMLYLTIMILGVSIIVMPALVIFPYSIILAVLYFIVSARVMYGLMVTLSELDLFP